MHVYISFIVYVLYFSECVICMDDGKRPNCIFCDCGHLVTCMDCATKLKICPICRSVIQQKIKVFQ